MIRILNFAFIAITGLVCLGLYRIAEEARVAAADLRATRAAIAHENDSLVVLGAEWARVTQPKRIQALAERHLKLSDQPSVQLSSLTALPSKNPPPLVPEGSIRNARAIVPQPGLSQVVPTPVKVTPGRAVVPQNARPFAALKTGT